MEDSHSKSGQTAFERDHLLNSLTVPSLQEIALIGGIVESKIKAAKGKQGLQSLLSRESDQERIWTVAHRLEALIPFKHVHLYSWDADTGEPEFKAFADQVKIAFPEAISSFRPLHLNSSEMQVQSCIVDYERSRVANLDATCSQLG